ncbi:hypothetical protein VTG60DRAFT_3314 [Thermothelomyces hinnuleus]
MSPCQPARTLSGGEEPLPCVSGGGSSGGSGGNGGSATGTWTRPACSCCLAYQAVKNRERVRRILAAVRNRAAVALAPPPLVPPPSSSSSSSSPPPPRPSRAELQEMVRELAGVCLRYAEAEALLARAACAESDEFRCGAVRLAGTMIQQVGLQLDALNDAVASMGGVDRVTD